MNPGKVTLVGAGPGDPDLLTLKALKAIRCASLLLVDDLVSPEVLAHAGAGARIMRVGKRGGLRSTPQDFIDRLMLRAARRGEHVVRLKGGDPFIFGRGGEEVERLRTAGVAVEVVNGITSGLAAATALGIALTHRAHAQGVVFLTGHARSGGEAPDWTALAAAAHAAHLTLVIYMGVRSAAQIEQQLRSGLPADTPVAIVQHASLPQQRQVVTVLGALAATIAREGLASPSVIIVGDVVHSAALAQAAAERIRAA